MIIDSVQQDLKEAQLSRDEIKVSTLRMLLSEINNAKISLRRSSLRGDSVEPGQADFEMTDEKIIKVIQKEVKKRKEAALGFRSGGREDSAQKEENEAKILESYLPEQLSNEELTEVIERSITELEAKGLINEVGATSPSDMGKVIGVVMGKVAGKADGGRVSGLVKERLVYGKHHS